MTRFVVFLRGMNVGGHVVKKQQLQEAFEILGFENVVAYKQSGNVILETNESDKEFKSKIEDQLRKMLGYDVAVFVRSIPQLKAIIDLNPFEGEGKEGTSFWVTMLPNTLKFPLQLPLIIPKSRARIVAAKDTEVFTVTHGGGEGALPNPFIELKLKVKATTRNMNIVREIVEKCH